MADTISFLENFPVKFGLVEDSCLECDTRSFCQLAEWGDRFEVAYEPSATDVTVTNGTFTGSLSGWTAGSGWTYNGGKARLTEDTGTLQQNINQTVGRKYKVCFDITNYSGTGSMSVYIGDTEAVTQVSANGSYCFYITPANANDLSFTGNAATFTLDLDNVTVELINEDCGIRLYNTETEAYVGNTLNANLSNAAIGTLGFSYLWSAFGVSTDGCYKIGIFDTTTGDNIISNGTFTGSATDWTITGFSAPDGWYYNSNNIKFYGTQGANITSYIDQDITSALTATATVYIITFTVSGYASGSTIPLVLNLVISGVEIPLASITANGTYSIATPAIDNSVTTLLRFGNNSVLPIPVAAPDTEWIVDTVAMTPEECEESTKSECYKIAEDHGCTTKMLKWTNNDVNGFNYPYSYFYSSANQYGFQHMRVECDLRNSRYPGDTSKYIDSGGNEIQYLGSVRKNKVLYIAAMPEYMHDALASGLKHKEFYLDDVRYVFQDTDYEPEWGNDRLTIAESQILIGKYTQDNYSID